MKSKFWLWLFPILLVLLFVFAGVLPRIRNQQELLAAVEREQNRVATVNVIFVTRTDANSGLTLPGQIQAIRETPLYARTQGFLKRRLVDIGTQVRSGQLLATIDAPELDQ